MPEHRRVYVFVRADGVHHASDAQRRRLPAPCPVRVGVSCNPDSFGAGTGAGTVHGAVRGRAYDVRSLHGLGIGHSFFAVPHSSIPLILWRFCHVHTCPVSLIRAGPFCVCEKYFQKIFRRVLQIQQFGVSLHQLIATTKAHDMSKEIICTNLKDTCSSKEGDKCKMTCAQCVFQFTPKQKTAT